MDPPPFPPVPLGWITRLLTRVKRKLYGPRLAFGDCKVEYRGLVEPGHEAAPSRGPGARVNVAFVKITNRGASTAHSCFGATTLPGARQGSREPLLWLEGDSLVASTNIDPGGMAYLAVARSTGTHMMKAPGAALVLKNTSGHYVAPGRHVVSINVGCSEDPRAEAADFWLVAPDLDGKLALRRVRDSERQS